MYISMCGRGEKGRKRKRRGRRGRRGRGRRRGKEGERKKNLCYLGVVLVVINTTKTETHPFVPVASDINYYNLFVLGTPV